MINKGLHRCEGHAFRAGDEAVQRVQCIQKIPEPSASTPDSGIRPAVVVPGSAAIDDEDDEADIEVEVAAEVVTERDTNSSLACCGSCGWPAPEWIAATTCQRRGLVLRSAPISLAWSRAPSAFVSVKGLQLRRYWGTLQPAARLYA